MFDHTERIQWHLAALWNAESEPNQVAIAELNTALHGWLGAAAVAWLGGLPDSGRRDLIRVAGAAGWDGETLIQFVESGARGTLLAAHYPAYAV